MPRTQSLARDFDPAFDRLTEVTGFGSNPGALRMFEYVPADPQPALVVVLHGCTQTAASYDFGAGWSTLADRHGFVLLLPEQQRAIVQGKAALATIADPLSRLVAAGVPPQFATQFAGGGSGVDLQGTGDLGQRILASVPPDQQAFVQPLIGAIVQAIYESVSIAIAASFWVGVVAAIVAAVLVLFLPETPMRDTFEMELPAAAA